MSAVGAGAERAGRTAFGTLLAPAAGVEPPADADGAGFALYDLAAFARGEPTPCTRSDLPRRRRRVLPGDVLVARALAPPRRAWVVAAPAGRIPVASDEWLVLRPQLHEPAYLRQLLVSNEFHLRFTQALAGASVAAARSARLRAIALPVPPRTQQQALARVLDLADALHLRRRRALAALEELADLLRRRGDAAAITACERMQGDMLASRRQLAALLSVLRDRAFRDEL